MARPLAEPWRCFLEEFGETPRLSGSVQETKEQMAKLREKLKSRYEMPGLVAGVSTTNHQLPGGPMAREYRANDAPDDAPFVVHFHGGGFVMGSVEEDEFFCSRVCLLSKVRVLSIEYGLAHQVKFPDTVRDSGWISTLVRDFTLEPVTLMGIGAGANIALAMALNAYDNDHGTDIKGVVAVSPLTMHPDAVPADQKALRTSLDDNDKQSINSKSAILSWLAEYGAQPNDPLVSVLLHPGLAKLRRVYVQGYGADTLRDDATFLVSSLAQAGVEVETAMFDGYPHLAFAFPSKHLDVHRNEFYDRVSYGVLWANSLDDFDEW